MRWQLWTLPAVGLFLSGCGAGRPSATAAPPPMIGRLDTDSAPVARAQKPDRPAPGEPIIRTSLPQPPSAPDARVAARIRAIVNSTPILDDELREATYQQLARIQSLPEPERTRVRKQIEKEELQNIIDREVILSEALAQLQKARPQMVEKLRDAASKEFDKTIRNIKSQMASQGMSITSDEELKAFFESQGISLDGMRRQRERQFMMREYIGSRVFPIMEKVGHEAVLEYYHDHPGEFQIEDRIEWKDLFVDIGHFGDRNAARAYAQQMLTRAQRGEDFQSLVKEYTNKYYSFNNGDGYGQRRGEIRPAEAEPVLFGMREGQIEMVEQATGYHIVKLTKRDYAGLQPLDDKLQGEIRGKIKSINGEREYKRILAELKQKAVIQIFEDP